MRILFPILLSAIYFAIPASARAQAFWNQNSPQTWPPGAYQPTDRNMPFSERYGYYVGPSFFFGMNGRQAYSLEYLDRVDRAERFGRPIPPPPATLSQPPRCRTARCPEPAPAPVPVPVPEPVELAPAPTKKP